jgi:hypothetical protein
MDTGVLDFFNKRFIFLKKISNLSFEFKTEQTSLFMGNFSASDFSPNFDDSKFTFM